MEDARTLVGESKPLQAQNRVSHSWPKQYTPPLYFCVCGGGRSSSPNTQLSLLSRLAGLGSFVGVRCTRFAHSAHPHCARRRILAFGSDPLFSARATSSTGRTLGAILISRPILGWLARTSGRRARIFFCLM